MNKTLYSIDSKGKTRIWRQEIEGNKYRTVSGLKDGNLVISEWTVCEGKNLGKSNETSPAEQAEAEVAAKYEKQLKTGYNFSESGAAKGTDYVIPMLAKKLSDREDKVSFPAMLDRKYNGGRIIGTKDGLFSRKGESWNSIVHIFESLKPFFLENIQI